MTSDPRTPVQRLLDELDAELDRIERESGERKRAAIERAGLTVEMWNALRGRSSLLSSEPRQSTMTGTEMTSSEFAKLPGEERRRLGIAKARGSKHPFPRALYRDGKTVTEWAKKHGLDRNIVKAWFAKGSAVRPIPRKYALEIARAYPDVPATEEIWRGTIKG